MTLFGWHIFVPHPYSFVPYSVMNYPYSIPSVAQIRAVLDNNPKVNNPQALQGAHTSNLIGTPIDPHAVTKAEGTVEVLSDVKSVFTSTCFSLTYYLEVFPDVITDPIVENRAHVSRETRELWPFIVV
jgi:hypothetical protein